MSRIKFQIIGVENRYQTFHNTSNRQPIKLLFWKNTYQMTMEFLLVGALK